MKSINHIKILLVFAALFIVSCDDGENYIETKRLDIAEADYEFTYSGGEGRLIVENPGGQLSAESSSDWLTITSVVNNTVNYSVAGEYYDWNNRTASIFLTAGGISDMVNVTQLAATINVDVSELFYEVPGGTLPLTVRTDGMPFRVENDSDWLSIDSSEDGVYTFRADANNDPLVRLDTVRIAYTRVNQTQYIKVPVLQVGTATIETFEGTYEMTYKDRLNADQSATITMSVEAGDLKAVGLAYPVFIGFDRGFLRIFGGAKVGEYERTGTTTTFTYDVVQAIYAPEDGGLYGGYSIRAIPVMDNNGKIVFSFHADGSLPGVDLNAFGFFAIDQEDATNTTWPGEMLVYKEILFTQQ